MRKCNSCNEMIDELGFNKPKSEFCKLCLLKSRAERLTQKLENSEIIPIDSLVDEGLIIVKIIGSRKDKRLRKEELIKGFKNEDIYPIHSDLVIVKTDKPKKESAHYLFEQIKRENKYKCAYCDKEATTVDHFIPVSKGGSWDRDNLLASCYNCNATKKDLVFDNITLARSYIRNENKAKR